MVDWNWFYSAVAQSTAAIVAIFGGFVATQIISNRTKFQERCGEIKDCIRTCLRITQEGETAGFPFIIANSRQGGLHSVEMRIYKDEPVNNTEHYYRTGNFSVFDDRQLILQKINELIENHKNNPNNPLTRIGVLSGEGAATRHHNDKKEAEDSINNFIISVNTQSALARTLAAEVENNPYSSRMVTAAIVGIIVLFFVGVIYPLSFMPSDGEPNLSIPAFWDILFSLRGALLSVISIIFTSIMLVFLLINVRLKFSQEDIAELNHYSMPTRYSAYLESAESNSRYINDKA